MQKEEVKRLARLVRLDLSDSELDNMTQAMEEMVAFADVIRQSVEGDAATITRVTASAVPASALREDAAAPSVPREELLSNAPSVNGMFTVKGGI